MSISAFSEMLQLMLRLIAQREWPQEAAPVNGGRVDNYRCGEG
jgi:hypothetical protein